MTETITMTVQELNEHVNNLKEQLKSDFEKQMRDTYSQGYVDGLTFTASLAVGKGSNVDFFHALLMKYWGDVTSDQKEFCELASSYSIDQETGELVDEHQDNKR